MKSPFMPKRMIRHLFAISCCATVAHGVTAQTLEERVKALEEGQGSQNETVQGLGDIVRRTEVSGFVSVRGGKINSDESLYLGIYGDKWTFSEESVVGLQVDTRVNDKLSASLQMKADGLTDGVELEWGYLEYAFQPDLKMRAGRLRMPGFMLSEYVDVGYAYPWVQVPYEVYGWLPFNRYEGLDLRYWVTVGDADIRFNPYVGTTSNQELRLGNIAFTDQSSRVAGLDVQMNYDIVTLRAGYSKYQFELRNSILDEYLIPLVNGVTVVPDAPPYIDGVKVPGLVDYVNGVMVGDGATPSSGYLTDVLLGVQNDLDPSNDFLIPVIQGEMASLQSQLIPYESIQPMNGEQDGEFYGVGINIDNGEFQIMSEFSRSEINGSYPDVESGYIMLGYRFGNWMPHFTFAKVYTVNDGERTMLQPMQASSMLVNGGGIPGFTGLPGYEQLVAGANQYTAALSTTMKLMSMEQETYTLGLRWDPTAGFALKAEVFVTKPQDTSYGFAIPKAVVAMQDMSLTELGEMDLEFNEPEDSITGVRVSLDMVF